AVLAAALGPTPALAESPTVEPEIHFERLTNRHGLTQMNVLSFAQDRAGFLWLGTQSSVERFDGYSVVSYPIPAAGGVRDLWMSPTDRLWLAFLGGGLGRFDLESEELVRFRHAEGELGSLASDRVRSLLGDGSGGLWVGTEGGLAHLPLEAEPGDFRFRIFEPEAAVGLPAGSNHIYDVEHDGSGGLWLGTGAGLVRFDPATGRFRHHPLPVQTDSATGTGDPPPPPPQVRTVLVDRDGRPWIAFLDRLVRLDGDSFTVFALPVPPSERETTPIFDLEEDLDGRIWIALFRHGLGRLDPASGEVRVFAHDDQDPQSLGPGSVLRLMRDRSGLLWVGNVPGGASYFRPAEPRFERHVYRQGEPEGLGGGVVLDLLEARDGALWVGFLSDGVDRRDPETGVFRHFRHDPEDPGSLSSNRVSALLEGEGGEIWVGTAGGLDRYRPAADRFERFRHDPADPFSIRHDNVEALAADGHGGIWVGMDQGVDHLDPSTGRFRRAAAGLPGSAELAQLQVMTLGAGEGGVLWVGSWDRGLWRFDPGAGELESFRHDPADPASLPQDTIRSLWVARDARVWVGTDGRGLGVLDPSTGLFRTFTHAQGLANDVVQGLLGDDDGRIWVATNIGLSRYDPALDTWATFDLRDGLQDLEFDYDACHRGASGRLYFGGIRGYNAFDPADFGVAPPPPVAFSRFRIQGRPSAIELAAPYLDLLELAPGERMFDFEFAALGFDRAEHSRYAYQLEGLDEDWVEVGRRTFGRYTSLPPGDYTLRVRGTGASGAWSPEGASIRVRVNPPWWRTRWASALWLVLAVGAVAGVLWAQRRRLEEERRINARLRAVDRMKDELVASTSHEIRTPLFGITGLAEALLEGREDQLDERTAEDLRLIVSSGRRLGTLVNDIMDVALLRRGHVELSLEAVDLEHLVREVLVLSRPLVSSEQVELVNAVPPGLPPVRADFGRLQQILHNLVGNAAKFTDQGEIRVEARVVTGSGDPAEARLEVAVTDTGVGIDPRDQRRIFESFEQAGSADVRRQGGVGLGLAITQRLVKLHGGEVRLRSKPGEGSSFLLDLPIWRGETPVTAEEAPIAGRTVGPGPDESGTTERPALDMGEPPADAPASEAASADPATPEAGASEAASSDIATPRGEASFIPATRASSVEGLGSGARGGRILVVDDEAVNRTVLARQLGALGHSVALAADGRQALDILGQEPIDLVLLDIMMPGFSGFEVCRELRRQFSAQELPVLFLTARNRVEDRVAGFAEGANDYLQYGT
ncbi:MAG: ATP-binding protein, partial [Holophagales bacterium]|nr:ATP-binding protein [Holophagales bacterium]